MKPILSLAASMFHQQDIIVLPLWKTDFFSSFGHMFFSLPELAFSLSEFYSHLFTYFMFPPANEWLV